MSRKKKAGEIVEKVKKTIKYRCPERGWVEQEVEIKRYKTRETPESTIDVSTILGEEEYSDETNYND
jgi:hypothetical protein